MITEFDIIRTTMATALNQRSIRKEIARIADAIAKRFKPEKIILFGSYAYGTPCSDSDVDLLVVIPFKGRSVYKALDIVMTINPSVPLDLIVRTPAQVRIRLAQNDFFLNNILKRGKVLYEAAHP